MGFDFGYKGLREMTDDFAPTVTMREFVVTFAESIEAYMALGSGAYRKGAVYLATGRPTLALSLFSRLVHERPRDPVAHRMLGLSWLQVGHLLMAATHLEIALALARRSLRGDMPLSRTLRLHWEAAADRLLLTAIYSRLKRPEVARYVALECFVANREGRP
jgi:Flp pilus assembly protein TadD